MAKVVDGKLTPTKFLDEGEVLKEMPEGTLLRHGQDIGFRLARREDMGMFGNVKLGELIGSGGNKNVYAIIGRSDEVVAILKKGKPFSSIDDELALLKQLTDQKLPVVKIIKKGIFEGQAAFIMKRYAQGSKDIVKRVGNRIEIVGSSGYLNNKSITDLINIKKLLKEKK